ncbi:amidohydrolase family protein [Nesterenkonia lutea]
MWTGGESAQVQDLVVREDRIVSITNPGAAPTQTDAEVIDGTGCTLIPGLIDAHVHLTTPSEAHQPRSNADFRANAEPAEKALHGYRNAIKALGAGVTTLRVIGHRNSAEAELRDLIERGSYIGPRLKVAPWWVTATGGHGDMFIMKGVTRQPYDTADGPYECRKLVRMQAAQGADFIKVMASGGLMSHGDKPEWPNYTVEELGAIVDEAHSLGLPVAAHAHSREGIRRSLFAGVDSIEHGTYLDDELREVMVEQGTYLVPTLLISAEVRDKPPGSVVSPEAQRAMGDILDHQIEQVAKAHQAGVKIAFGTDSSGNVCEFGRHARELALYVQAGMTPSQALRTSSVYSAELLGVSESIGAVEEGKAADLLLVEGDPLSDISVLTRTGAIRRVVIRGVDVTAFSRLHSEVLMP